jgi:hypothetical protein
MSQVNPSSLQAINNSPLNRSVSKAMFSFTKSNRFSPQKDNTYLCFLILVHPFMKNPQHSIREQPHLGSATNLNLPISNLLIYKDTIFPHRQTSTT